MFNKRLANYFNEYQDTLEASDTLNTPAKRKHVLVEHLHALFNFIGGVDSVNGWFSVKSVIMNGFLKEHQDIDLSTKEKANEFAKNKLKTVRKYHLDGLVCPAPPLRGFAASRPNTTSVTRKLAKRV